MNRGVTPAGGPLPSVHVVVVPGAVSPAAGRLGTDADRAVRPAVVQGVHGLVAHHPKHPRVRTFLRRPYTRGHAGSLPAVLSPPPVTPPWRGVIIETCSTSLRVLSPLRGRPPVGDKHFLC